MDNVSVAPHLYKKAEFEAALVDYQPNPEARHILARTPLVTMLAPTSTGRNTIITELLKTGRYHFIISDTTRPKRYNDGILEQDGVQYFFREEEDVLADIKNGLFVEAEVIFGQQVSGVSIREIEKTLVQNKIAITDVDLMGSLNIEKLKPNVVSVVVLPPSFKEWMRRLHKRTQVTDLELYRRLQTASRILRENADRKACVFVVNDDLATAVNMIDSIASKGSHDEAKEVAARQLAKTLYTETCDFLLKNAPDFKPY